MAAVRVAGGWPWRPPRLPCMLPWALRSPACQMLPSGVLRLCCVAWSARPAHCAQTRRAGVERCVCLLPRLGARARTVAWALRGMVARALLEILCHGQPVYDAGYVGWGSPGLFSMLNSVADELLFHVYRGERPRSVEAFYRNTSLIGYGRATLSAHFEPWSCDGIARPPGGVHVQSVPVLLNASRYVVASHLLHALYQPRQGAHKPTPSAGATDPWYAPERRFDVAVHLRRGDKLVERRNSERIALWNESQVVTAVTRLLKEARKQHVGAPSGDRQIVLLASDDNAFALSSARLLRAAQPQVDVVRPPNAFDKGTTAPFDACSASCIGPLQQLYTAFAHTHSLLLSSKSNMGAFFLSYWGAANGEQCPSFIDMEAKTHLAQLKRGRHFCALAWGSRHGMCESNRTGEHQFGPPPLVAKDTAKETAKELKKMAKGILKAAGKELPAETLKPKDDPSVPNSAQGLGQEAQELYAQGLQGDEHGDEPRGPDPKGPRRRGALVPREARRHPEADRQGPQEAVDYSGGVGHW